MTDQELLQTHFPESSQEAQIARVATNRGFNAGFMFGVMLTTIFALLIALLSK